MKEEYAMLSIPFKDHLDCVIESIECDIQTALCAMNTAKDNGKIESVEEYKGYIANQTTLLEYIKIHPSLTPTPHDHK